MSMKREFTHIRSIVLLCILATGTASCGLKFGADARQASENSAKTPKKTAFVEVDNTQPDAKIVKAKTPKVDAEKSKMAAKEPAAKPAEFVRVGKHRRVRRTQAVTSAKTMEKTKDAKLKSPVDIVKGVHKRAKNAVRAVHEKVMTKLGLRKPVEEKVLYPTVRLFGARLNESKWLRSSTELECRVTHPIPKLGRAIFQYNPVQKLRFIFEVDHPPARNLDKRDKRYARNLMTDKYPYPNVGAKLESVPTKWKPFAIKKMLGYIPFKEGPQPFVLPHRKDLLATEKKSEKMRKGLKTQVQVASLTTVNYLPEIWPDRLMYELEEGMSLRVTYRDWTDGTQDIITSISPIAFNKVKSEFEKCIAKLPKYDFNKFKKTKLNFTKRQRTLSKKMRTQLRNMVKFIKLDEKIKKVMIKSYTDSMGFKRVNRNDAKIQAQAIKRYMRKLGMKIPITAIGIGEGPFIGSNRSSAGRAKNRRSLITLIK